MSGIYNAGSTAVELITVCCLSFVSSVSNSDELRGAEPSAGLTAVPPEFRVYLCAFFF